MLSGRRVVRGGCAGVGPCAPAATRTCRSARSRPSRTAAARATRSSGVRLVSTGPSVARAFPAVPSPFSVGPEPGGAVTMAQAEEAGRRVGAGRRLGPGRIRAASGQGRGPPAGALRPAGAGRPAARPARSRPPRPGPAAPTARSASATGSTRPSAPAAWCCTIGASLTGRANIDHLVVVASGVWVIDTKHYRGRLDDATVGGWFVPRPRLFVAGRDQSRLVTSARRQQAAVAEALVATGPAGAPRPGRAVLHRRRVGLFARPFIAGGRARHLAPGRSPGPVAHRGRSDPSSGVRWRRTSLGPSRPLQRETFTADG